MTAADDKTRNRVSGALMQLRAKAPFFGVLALHAEYVEDRSVPTAATDGRRIFYNPDYFGGLSGPELTGVLLHEVLHCAYLHVTRRGRREPLRWNIAADYVVNSMVPEVEGAELPAGVLVSNRYEGRRVEEVYDMLPTDLSGLGFDREWLDIRLPRADESGRGGAQTGGSPAPGSGGAAGGRLTHETYWRNAINGAVQAHRARGNRGRLPQGVELLVKEVAELQVDWRDKLRDFTVHHPFDFGEFDLRLVGRGVYEEQLEGERLELSVCMDTSGSCLRWIPRFVGELKAMLEAYPHVSASLYYADAALHGPFEVDRYEEIPSARGGGGTDFRPFFQHVKRRSASHAHQVLVYLTDGYGAFPAAAPDQETVWVVTPGGLQEDGFPFGRTVRLGSAG